MRARAHHADTGENPLGGRWTKRRGRAVGPQAYYTHLEDAKAWYRSPARNLERLTQLWCQSLQRPPASAWPFQWLPASTKAWFGAPATGAPCWINSAACCSD